MNVQFVKTAAVRLNKANPRIIRDERFRALVKSIREFPKMLEIRPIVVDSTMTVLGGNMRLRACIEAGLDSVPIILADTLSDAEKQRFIIADNVGFGDWDWDALANEWDVAELGEWGLELRHYSFANDLNEEDLDFNAELDVWGEATGRQFVSFVFDSPEAAKEFLDTRGIEYKKHSKAWQVNLTTQST